MKCRYCRQPLLSVLDLGRIPLVNYFPKLRDAARIKKYPLRLCYCPSCGLGQTGETIAPKKIFSEYHYQSGASAPLVRHLMAVADTIRSFTPASVLDIGCNDGTLLSFFARTGIRTVGVEPAKNIASIARHRGIPVMSDFFGEKLAKSIRRTYGMFDIITITHTLANIPDLPDFFRGVKELLSPKGRLLVEVASFEDMLSNGIVDSIYHEHYWYFTRYALIRVLSDAGLGVIRVNRGSAQGGSLMVVAESGVKKNMEVKKIPINKLIGFYRHVTKSKKRLLGILQRFHGKTMIGFGAPAKAVTCIHWLGLTHKDLSFIVDSTQEKQGRVIPGTTIPVYPEMHLIGAHIDAVIVFSWNYRSEIFRKLSRYIPVDTPIITPFPNITVQKFQ